MSKFSAGLSARIATDSVGNLNLKQGPEGRTYSLGLEYRAMSVGALGDSRTKQSMDYAAAFNGAVGDYSYSNYGFLTWWMYFSSKPFRLQVYATSGETSAGVVANQLGAAIAAKHDIYTLFVGVNDGSYTGQQTADNILKIYQAVRHIGKKLVIITDTPTESFTSSRARYDVYTTMVMKLAATDPANVRLVHARNFSANPADVDGAAYTAATNFDLTYDTTHPNLALAAFIGWELARVTRSWADWFANWYGNGESSNLLINPALGGTAGTLGAGAQAGSAIADSWTCNRSTGTVSHNFWKSRNVPTRWIANTAVLVGQRLRVYPTTGFHYLVTVAGTTDAATPPSSTTLFGSVANGSATLMVVPENDAGGTPLPGESQIMESWTSGSNNESSTFQQTVSTGFSEGDMLQAAIRLEPLDTDWQGFSLRVTALTSGSAKIVDAHGMAYNQPNNHGIYPKTPGLVITPPFPVPPNTASLSFRFYVFNRSGSIKTRFAFSNPYLGAPL